MTDSPSPIDPDNAPPGIDTSVPHPARVYDYILGGTNHFPVDRDLGDKMAAATGGLERLHLYARVNRDFLGRAVRHLINEAGVQQFLDIGTGIPGPDNVHGVAQRTSSRSRVVYVDRDPLVLAHANILLESTTEGSTAFIDGDLLKPRSILLRAAATLDLSEPVAVMLIALLHLIADDDEPHAAVKTLMDAVPSGSYLVLTHMATDIEVEKMAEFKRTPERISQPLPFAFAMRDRPGVLRFLDGLDVVEPGVVRAERWRPDPGAPTDIVTPMWAAVARKP
jgi:hypothetical protein